MENIQKFGVPVVVAINEFPADTPEEIELVRQSCNSLGAEVALSRVWAEGGAGGEDLAHKIAAASASKSQFKPLYDLDQTVRSKIETVCQEIYGADGVDYSTQAGKMIDKLEGLGYGSLPVCMAKTQNSLSDDPDRRGRPRDFRVTVREVRLSAGAGFIVALAGNIMTMPGLSKNPAAERIDILPDGRIVGLF